MKTVYQSQRSFIIYSALGNEVFRILTQGVKKYCTSLPISHLVNVIHRERKVLRYCYAARFY